MLLLAFKILTLLHIVTGTVGLISFWVPIVARKGKALHRRVGFLFAYAMLATGALGIPISLISLAAPLQTHPLFDDPVLVRAQFGWLLLYLAILTVGLSWAGLTSIAYKKDHPRHRTAFGIVLQVVVVAAAINCSYQGWLVQKSLISVIGIIGLASGLATLFFIFMRNPAKTTYLHFHVRSAVGAGIGAYTAFLSVMLVRVSPDNAFNPWLWAIPTAVGSLIIGYHEVRMYLARFRAAFAKRRARIRRSETTSAPDTRGVGAQT